MAKDKCKPKEDKKKKEIPVPMEKKKCKKKDEPMTKKPSKDDMKKKMEELRKLKKK